MKQKSLKRNPKKTSKPKLAPSNERVKTMLMVAPQSLKGPGFMKLVSKGSTRWERLKNVVLFVWGYVWHGKAQL